MMRRQLLALGVLLAGAGCEGRAPEAAGRALAEPVARGAAGAPDRFASLDAGVVAGGPGAGRRYGLGRTATRAAVEAWNTDVGPDGAELPRGRGDVATGGALFAAKCASCHGRNGEGMPPAFPTLVGRDPKAERFVFASDPKLVKTIGNYWPNATTVFDYVKRAMPLTQPGSLSDDDAYALTAWLLAANDVIPKDAVLDAGALRKVAMPYADRFVPDTRRGGAEVK